MRHEPNTLNTHLMRQISWLTAAGMHPTAGVFTFAKTADVALAAKVAKHAKRTSA
jgi:hypothetical protein